MDKQKADILQIQKYLNGELDAKAMHRLEREAQHDPFLMDALEGYEQVGAGQQRSLDILAERLAQRVGKKEERRIIPMWMLAAAAGVAGFLIVVGLLYKQNNTVKPPLTAQQVPANAPQVNVTPPVVNADTTPVSIGKPTIADKTAATADGRTHQPAAIHQETATLNLAEVRPDTVKQAGTIASEDVLAKATPLDERVMDVLAKNKDKGAADTNAMPQTVAITKKPLSQPLNGKVEGVSIKEREGKRESSNAYYLGSLAPPPAKDQLKGVVLNRPAPTDGSTSNQANNTGLAAPAGKVKSAADAQADNNAGYNSPVTANSLRQDSVPANFSNTFSKLNTVTIAAPNNLSLSAAHPKNGWADFNTYASQHIKMPATAKTGTVSLVFTVSAKGSISNMKVARSVSPEVDKQAIGILRNGPRWTGNTNGQPETVTLDIKLEHAEN